MNKPKRFWSMLRSSAWFVPSLFVVGNGGHHLCYSAG